MPGLRRVFALIVTIFCSPVLSQIQISSVRVAASDPSGALVRNATVKLTNPINHFSATAINDPVGDYVLENVPFDQYTVTVDAPGFQSAQKEVIVRSNLPVRVEIRLRVSGTREVVQVAGPSGLVEADSTSTETDIAQDQIEHAALLGRNHALQTVVATAPGFVGENDGLIHVRGADDGVLYVIDGIPIVDRVDAQTGISPDLNAIRSLNVMTGSIPAEFGGRSGAVVQADGKSGLDSAWIGNVGMAGGSSAAGNIASALGGSVGRNLGVFVAGSFSRSERFLDPPDPGNFNNRGGDARFSSRLDFKLDERDLLLLHVFAAGADFHVPNTELQEEAGQRQREEFRNDEEALSWNRVWSGLTQSSLAYYRQSYGARLFGSEFDIPLFAAQDRHHLRQGTIGNLTHSYKGHFLKGGFGYSHIASREFFTFGVTDPEIAEDQGFSEEALAFTPDDPFLFSGSGTFGQASGFLQDDFSPLKNLTVNAGLRFDHSSVLVSDHQWSPRLGAVYYLPASQTAFRLSFNRLFMPAQIENLLLSSSEQARDLSPFVSEIGRGGSPVHAERVSACELGVSQGLREALRLDLVFWDRHFRNFDDPNVLFSTAIIFPNTVASGFARGLDVRLDVPEHRGWSGYLSYTNSRVRQTGPINGGLFLDDDVIEIGPGTHFVPDHDQRNVADGGVTYSLSRRGTWATLSARHESGVPLEVDPDDVADLQELPGADLVDFSRLRVRPRTVVAFAFGTDLLETRHLRVRPQVEVENVFNSPFVYNFGNPFSGTHFGYPRLVAGRLQFEFR